MGSFTDPRDNEVYKTVKIGKQTWMAENLRFNEDGSKCQKHGRLYDWETAITACPIGWHLPSLEEWQTLVDFVGGDKIAGDKLKATSGWNHSGNGTDNFHFSALPDGHYKSDGFPLNSGDIGYWWSSSESYDDCAHSLNIHYSNPDVVFDNAFKKSILLSVRCIKDNVKNKSHGVVKSKCGSFTDRQNDGKVYKTVKIGKQTWMAENFAYDAPGSKSYDNKKNNCKKYGRLYDWETAKAACPKGWHLPSNAEWDELYRNADGSHYTSTPYSSQTAGKSLKAASGWSRSGNGTDTLGFSALPGGFGDSDDSFNDVGCAGHWWSASEEYFSSDNACSRSMYHNNDQATYTYDDKGCLLSVRYVKD